MTPFLFWDKILQAILEAWVYENFAYTGAQQITGEHGFYKRLLYGFCVFNYVEYMNQI